MIDLVPGKYRLALAVLLLLVCPCESDLLYAQDEKPGPSRVWQVKESSTRLWIAGGSLVSASPQDGPESIPLSAITALAYVTTSDNPAADEIGAWVHDLLDVAADSGEAAGFTILPIVAGAAIPSLFLPVRKSRHLVYVDWKGEGKKQECVYLLGKSDAISLLSELRRATGLWCSNPSQARCSNWLALKQKPTEAKESVGQYERGRLVVVDRGHGISYLGMVLLPQPDPPASVGCPEVSHFEVPAAHEEVEPQKDGQQASSSPESTKPKLKIPTSLASGVPQLCCQS